MTWRIMPWLFLGWVMNWIDRINIGFAHLGFKDEFAISEAQFGVMVGVYAIGYLLLEVPSNMLMERIGARKTMSRIMLLWGLITVATGFACGFNPSMQRIDESAQPAYRSLVFFEDAH
ncbi:hypothetical protein WT11_03420 [Burkholderia stagnalis]|nr:hypothetical protein WT11_03420 [Burkholderia stagnalis]